MLFSAVKDLIILILLTVSDNLELLSTFSFLAPAQIADSIMPVKIKIGDKASVTREILQEAKKAITIPVINDDKL